MHAEPAVNSAAVAAPITLSNIAVGQTVVIHKVLSGTTQSEDSDVGLRLLELGFVEGEMLRVVAQGFPGHEPIAVRIGSTTFALRRFEADHVMVVAAEKVTA
jgi:ferrous iron transport protein A